MVVTDRGNLRANRATESALQDLENVDAALFVGIAGGCRDGVNRGDVVVANKVHYQHPGKQGEKGFEPRPTNLIPHRYLTQVANAVIIQKRWQGRIKPPTDLPEGADSPKAHLEPIASGEVVVANKDSVEYQIIKSYYPDAHAIENEAAGFLNGIRERIPALIIRGVSDLLEGKTEEADRLWQPVAAACASAFAFELLATTSFGAGEPPTPGRSGFGAGHEDGEPDVLATIALRMDGDPAEIDNLIDRIQESLRARSGHRELSVRSDGGGELLLATTREAAAALIEAHSSGELGNLLGHSVLAVRSEFAYRNSAAIREAFASFSKSLFDWPQTLPQGDWINRPEINFLERCVLDGSSSTTLVLGQPGSGKSALLARLAGRLEDAGVVVLGIKADFLDPAVRSQQDLGDAIGLPADVFDSVRHLAAESPVAILIDQLDALASLVDLRSSRLNVLLELIRKLSDTSNVHLIASCRTFEHRHDVRLTTLEAERLELQLPSWDQVAGAVAGVVGDAEALPARLRELLRLPQALRIFLQIAADTTADAVGSYQAMLDSLWELRVLGQPDFPDAAAVLTQIAGSMAELECLWLPVARFEDRIETIRFLEASGMLARSPDRSSIAFSHQTLFEHAMARSFAKGTPNLASYTLERQNALFVRSKLWAGLNYLRAVSPDLYHRELTALWGSPSVRAHIRHLLTEFLGQQSEPSDAEVAIFSECLVSGVLRTAALRSAAGNRDWFDHLHSSALPPLLEEGELVADGTLLFLSRALPFARQQVLDLISTHWVLRPELAHLAWIVLEDVELWDDAIFDRARRILDISSSARARVPFLVPTLASTAPAAGFRLLRLELDRRLRELKGTEPPAPPEPPNDLEGEARKFWQLMSQRDDRFDRLFSGRSQGEWYGLLEAAARNPAAFIEELWPWFTECFELAAADAEASSEKEYRRTRSGVQLASVDLDDPDHSLIGAVAAAVKALARLEPDAFVAWAQEACTSDVMIAHRLISLGMTELARSRPTVVLAYLESDVRTLFVGSWSDMISETEAVVRAVALNLDPVEVDRVERLIASHDFLDPAEAEDATSRQRIRKMNRARRLRLLRQIPGQKLSEGSRQLVAEESRAIPEEMSSAHREREFGFVGSPMTSDQMERATTEQILNIFNELDDSTGWQHPRHFMEGGSIQLSREFATFAKENPERAIAIIQGLSPGRHDRPVGCALEKLGETQLPSEQLFDLVLRAEERGFSGDEYRNDVASLLRGRAVAPTGLPQRLCDLLERWLAEAPERERHSADVVREEKREQEAASVLFPYSALQVVPGGNFWLLSAVIHAYMLREPVENERLLNLLETHWARSESVEVWQALCPALRYLARHDRVRSEAFLDSLFVQFPEVLGSQQGAILVADVQRWASLEVVHRWLLRLLATEWDLRHQAFGEILFLRSVTKPEDSWADDRVAAALVGNHQSARDVRLGLAFAASHLWDNVDFRREATEILRELLPTGDARIARAFMTIFANGALRSDADSRAILEAILSAPDCLKVGDPTWLITRLAEVVQAEATRVFEVCRLIVEKRAGELGSIAMVLGGSAPELVNIALTLQRLGGENRANGLGLFEKLLEVRAYGTAEALLEVDGRASEAAMTIRTPRPRRRSR